MNFIDSHGHLSKEYYTEDLEEVVERAVNAGVTKIILPCVSSQSLKDMFDAVERFPQHLFPLIGLHPTDIPEDMEAELARLEPCLSDSRVLGVGEVGMDLYHTTETLEQQKYVFRRQLEWARERHLPLSMHIRSAYPEALEVMRPFVGDGLRGILHCFSGGIREAEWAVRAGLLLGIGGVVTFKNSKLQEIVREVGLDHLALETDCPFLAPVPYRGQRNESSYIPIIAQKVADILECPVERVAEATTANVEKLFFTHLKS
ncbi:MAG: TatD family hydrolase [Bacteroidales bacterium]|nr:TatD family hydrolase [Bacteroidales bacterium]